jgi:hypothetical protein
MGGNGTGVGSFVSDGPFASDWNVVYDQKVRVGQGLSRGKCACVVFQRFVPFV